MSGAPVLVLVLDLDLVLVLVLVLVLDLDLDLERGARKRSAIVTARSGVSRSDSRPKARVLGVWARVLGIDRQPPRVSSRP